MEFTYQAIADALASEGIACRVENMGGGCAALAVAGSRGGDWIYVGNGEWNGRDMSEAVWNGTVSVTTETADGIYSGDSDEYALCTSAYGVLAAVVALLNDGAMDCGACGESHHVFGLEENTRHGVDPMPTFSCPVTAGE